MKKTIDYTALLGEANPLARFPQLKEAALDEFAKKSFEDASLNDILRKAEMSKGSLYHHFGDKFGLFVCVIDTVIQKKIAFFMPRLKQFDSSDFFAFFKQLTHATVEFMLQDPRIQELSTRTMELPDSTKERLFSLFPYDFNQSFGPAIEAAIKAGQISSRFSSEFIAKVFEVLLFSAPKLVPGDASTQAIVEMINNLTDLIQYGVLANSTDTEGP